jgi:shikimate kinase
MEINNIVVATGGGTPCFLDNLNIINENGKSFYLQWKNEDLYNRIKIDGTENRPLLHGKSDTELMSFINESISYREYFYKNAHFIVNERSDEALAEKIYNLFQLSLTHATEKN